MVTIQPQFTILWNQSPQTLRHIHPTSEIFIFFRNKILPFNSYNIIMTKQATAQNISGC